MKPPTSSSATKQHPWSILRSTWLPWLGVGLVFTLAAILIVYQLIPISQNASAGQADPAGPNSLLAEPTAGPTPAVLRLDACGFILDYPSSLAPDGASFQVRFEALNDPQTWLWIGLRPNTTSQESSKLQELSMLLQLRYFSEPQNGATVSLRIKDAQNIELEALQQDILNNGEMTRLVVILRPDASLGSDLHGSVLYEIVFHTLQNRWPHWQPVIDAMLEQLTLRDCLDF